MLTPTIILCDQCGCTFPSTYSTRRVHRFCGQPCWAAWRKALPRKITPFQIRRLGDDEPVPTSKPRRYRTQDGYVVLRWKVGLRSYVEALEHRIVAGRDAPQVHHKNGDKTDNSPENLQPVTPLEHGAEHSKIDYTEAAALYAAGWSVPMLARRYGVHHVGVMRGLKSRGVKMRTMKESWELRRNRRDADGSEWHV